MEFVKTGVIQAVWASILLAIVLFIAFRTGIRVLTLTGTRWVEEEPEAYRLFAFGAGLSVLALGVLAIGLAGFLDLGTLSLWMIALLLFSLSSPPLTLLKRDTRPPFWLAAPAGAVFLLAWLQSMVPPIESDALAYHLAYAREYLIDGRISYLRHSVASMWPFQTELLFTLGLLFQGTSLAKLFHCSFYVLTAWAVYIFGRRRIGPRAAAWAALVFIFTPAAFAQSSQAYVDLALAFFVFLSFQTFLMDRQIGEARAAWWSGVFMGAALGTKYLALGYAGILFLFWALRSRTKVKSCGLFFLGAFLVGGVWYLRSWLTLGNPVYPFFPGLFGQGYEMNIRDGMGHDPLALMTFPWNITMRPAPFGGELLGPLYLMFLPFLVWKLPHASREGRWTASFVALGALFLFTQSQQVRYFLTLAPFMALGCGAALDEAWGRGVWLRRALAGLFLTVLVVHAGIFIHRLRQSWPVALGLQSAESYLRDRERSFRGYEFLKQNRRPEEKVYIAGEKRTFYDQGVRGLIPMPAMRLELERNGIDFDQYLADQRFDLIWVEESGVDRSLEELLKRHYRQVFSYDFTERPAEFRYGIYRRK